MPSTDTARSVHVFLDIDGVLNVVTRRRSVLDRREQGADTP
jgi:hypothetical protein